MIYTIESIYGSPDGSTASASVQLRNSDGVYRTAWVRAVPQPWYPNVFERMRDAWTVLRGQAIALRYPRSGELEEALRMALVAPLELRD